MERTIYMNMKEPSMKEPCSFKQPPTVKKHSYYVINTLFF